MGNALDLPQNQRMTNGDGRMDRSAHRLQATRPVILPFNNFNIRPDGIEETDVKSSYSTSTPRGVEFETSRADTSFSSMMTSGSKQGRYIKRYRNEEEKLTDMLQEKEAMLRSAIRQGQQLRAKCDRYTDEIENLKAINAVDMTDALWKKKYNDMDKKYRDIKEEMDTMVARNKNGRDFLKQQQETIEQLNTELRQERLARQKSLSGSIPSLNNVIATDKKGKRLITQLQVDKGLLEDRVKELTERNQRGREYLMRLENEKKEQDAIISKLKIQLLQEKADKETLMSRLSDMASTVQQETKLVGSTFPRTVVQTDEGDILYTQVNKDKNSNRLEPVNDSYKDETPVVTGIQNGGYRADSPNTFDSQSNGYDGHYSPVERSSYDSKKENSPDPVDSKSTGFDAHFSPGDGEESPEVSKLYDSTEPIHSKYTGYNADVDNANEIKEKTNRAKSNLYEEVLISNGDVTIIGVTDVPKEDDDNDTKPLVHDNDDDDDDDNDDDGDNVINESLDKSVYRSQTDESRTVDEDTNRSLSCSETSNEPRQYISKDEECITRF